MASIKILEKTQVTPSKSSTDLSFSLNFFDIFWLKFHPIERIFFYELTGAAPTFFNSIIVPKLKRSLSLCLLHFLPVAGNIIWPDNQHETKPFVFYTPNDGVSVTVAESDADFSKLSGNQMREAIESRLYIPELPAIDSKVAAIAFQITLFPNQGFSIGVSSHHAIFDGKSINMFLKAWAYICKKPQENYTIDSSLSLPEELSPILDRELVKDPYGLDMIYVKNWMEAKLPGLNINNPRSLKLWQHKDSIANFVRATYELIPEDINKIRRKIASQLYDSNQDNSTSTHHLSKFVVCYAYTSVCHFKSINLEKSSTAVLIFTADCRARLDPSLPSNYFGNCISSYVIFAQAEHILAHNGMAYVAEKLSEKIKGLQNEEVINEGLKHKLGHYIKAMEGDVSGAKSKISAFSVAGSPKFEAYGIDFGWGKPKKMEICSLDNESISMGDSRNGGVEIGVVMKNKHHLEMFDSLFVNGLKNL